MFDNLLPKVHGLIDSTEDMLGMAAIQDRGQLATTARALLIKQLAVAEQLLTALQRHDDFDRLVATLSWVCERSNKALTKLHDSLTKE
jgi:hypothetical protein